MRSPVSCVLVAALALVTASAAAAAPPGAKVVWNPCYGEFGPFECGTVHVPLDYDDPDGATISIAAVRLPASDPARRIGSLFLNPGGPGGSGFEFALFAAPFLYSDEVRARFDIVGFDPRGIEHSTALRCFGSERQWEPYFSTPDPFPVTPEDEALWAVGDRYLSDACDQRGGRILDHMSTADAARDLDLLREAVGDEQLTYAGYSYGSYLGVTYASLFPDKVRAMVVDGVLDPIAWATGVPGDGPGVPVSTRIHSADGAGATLDEFFRLCDAGGSSCAFAGGASSRFAALADRLKSQPVPFTTPDGFVVRVNYPILIAIALGAMYDPYSWPSFAQLLADLEAAAPAAVLGADLDRFWRSLGLTKSPFPHYSNLVEGFPGVLCADSDNPTDPAAWSAAAAAEQARYGYFGPIWTWASSACASWPGTHEDRYIGPFDKHTANPVLVMSTVYDPATRYQGAQTVAALLPNSRLATVAGWGHATLFLSRAADEAVSQYLVNGTLPQSAAVFQPDVVPFHESGQVLVASSASDRRARLTGALVPDMVRRVSKGVEGVADAGESGASRAALAGRDVTQEGEPPLGRPPSGLDLASSPNPFRGTTTIRFAVPERSQVRLSVFTLLGQEVARLVDGEVEPGYRSVQWPAVDRHGRPLPSGVYMYRLQAKSLTTGEYRRVGKMTLLK